MEIIAEIGQNHNGDMRLAAELIRSAKENGADVAKFQLFDVEKVFPKKNYEWYEYNCKTQLSRGNVLWLAEECKKVDIEFMASVFDVERVAWLEEAGVRRYKIASRSIHDSTLIAAIIKTGKPIIVSLGCWQQKEFPNIESCAGVSFLYCIANYPAALEDLKLNQVDFQRYAGFSDHSVGLTAAFVALVKGAQIIEKHFTLDKHMYGPDHLCSMTPEELRQLHTFRLEVARCL